ncbi:phosphoenolpyruvate--protein phosphotransferase [Limnobacter sp.]|uniref:phosphoenolpyruvate--protein phosphotransferase n=3 Tax=Limnobacter sp. TaxID=2003368 RepID=UPI00258312E0|nr:phosphoenolpyruvate--protein phosphotransferase [Limnobacter sp.]
MTLALHGIAVSRGIALSRALVWDSALKDVPRNRIDKKSVRFEKKRFDNAVNRVTSELCELRANLTTESPAEFDALLNLHRLILEDPILSEEPKALIQSKLINAEWALLAQMEVLLEQFSSIEDEYFRERNADVRQVVERVLKSLRGHATSLPLPPEGDSEDPWLIVAHDISPADMVQLKGRRVGAFVTEVGGSTSHTAIVARSLGIPAVVGIRRALEYVHNGDLVVVDGKVGAIFLDPTQSVIDEYQRKQAILTLSRQRLKRLKNSEAKTQCGRRIELMANIELPEDVSSVVDVGADGVGLFRSEFLFMSRKEWPSEDEQFEAYRKVIKAMKGKPVTVRTLDLGADKTLQFDSANSPPASSNSALGLRSIRFSLSEPAIFLTQIRALLRASKYGPVKVLLPMLTNLQETQQALTYIDMAREQLLERRFQLGEPVPVGGMVEVPAVALSMPCFLKYLDFVSIGTNDLIQYVLAVDRVDHQVAHLYDPLHPAILRLVYEVIQAANKAQAPVSVCGEMAGDIRLTRLLLGMGLTQYSMHPAQLLDVKELLLKTDFDATQKLVKRIVRGFDPDKIEEVMRELLEE